MGRLSTHVLDIFHGRPAGGVRLELFRLDAQGARTRLAQALTNADGRTDAPLLAGADFAAGSYEIHFGIGAYFAGIGIASPFLDIVPLRFTIAEPGGHYHVPLLCSPFAYSTYRGS